LKRLVCKAEFRRDFVIRDSTLFEPEEKVSIKDHFVDESNIYMRSELNIWRKKNNNNNNNNEFAVAFPRGGSSSTVSRSNWNLEIEERWVLFFSRKRLCRGKVLIK